MIGLHRTFYASSGNCCRESICTFCETELEKEGNSRTTPCISWPARPVVRRLLPITSCTSPHVTLLVNAKTHGKAVLHMMFERAKGQVRSPVKPTRVALEIGRCRIKQQSHMWGHAGSPV